MGQTLIFMPPTQRDRFLSSTLKVMDGFQPHNTGVILGVPDVPVRVTVLWPTFGTEPYAKTTLILHLHYWNFCVIYNHTWQGGSLWNLDVAFGITVLWPTWCRPKGHKYFKFTLAFPELFLKTIGWFTTKLNGSSLGALGMPFGGNCTLAVHMTQTEES